MNTTTATTFAYAGFWKRFFAYLLDLVIIAVFTSLTAVPVVLLFGLSQADIQSNNYMINLLGFLLGWLYWALMESSTRQATLGKLALGIKVTGLSGARISFGTASLRYFSKIISWVILMIGFLMAAFTQKKQALHDLIAETLVVNR